MNVSLPYENPPLGGFLVYFDFFFPFFIGIFPFLPDALRLIFGFGISVQL